ncbi:hypothetical protein AB1N83_007251 [Pleurotus pulmonarius]
MYHTHAVLYNIYRYIYVAMISRPMPISVVTTTAPTICEPELSRAPGSQSSIIVVGCNITIVFQTLLLLQQCYALQGWQYFDYGPAARLLFRHLGLEQCTRLAGSFFYMRLQHQSPDLPE